MRLTRESSHILNPQLLGPSTSFLSWEFLSSAMLRGACWYFVTDVSAQLMGPEFKSKSVQTDFDPLTVKYGTGTKLRCVTSQKSECHNTSDYLRTRHACKRCLFVHRRYWVQTSASGQLFGLQLNGTWELCCYVGLPGNVTRSTTLSKWHLQRELSALVSNTHFKPTVKFRIAACIWRYLQKYTMNAP